MTKVVLYARSSASDQNLDHQFRSMRSALGPEATVVATYIDLTQASEPKRPALRQTLDDLEDRSDLPKHS
jgi:DNA invertase Pin-like site-specific DNA recombinase